MGIECAHKCKHSTHTHTQTYHSEFVLGSEHLDQFLQVSENPQRVWEQERQDAIRQKAREM